MPKISLEQAAAALERRLLDLSLVSDDRDATTRTFLSPAMARANRLVGKWMRASGLDVREDRVGNLLGRLRVPGRRTLVLGSHLDTVRDAGRFDGALGVLLPLAALDVLRSRGVRLSEGVEVAGFSEEEGVRFSRPYLGSKGYAGRLQKSDLEFVDAEGVTVGQALSKRLGHRFVPPPRAHPPSALIGYVEVHIEQGPVLEDQGAALGVVSAIAGQTRAGIRFGGRAGHAGTTPMGLRRDALAGAAEFMVAVEAFARRHAPLVATVGTLSVEPGASNVIAGSVYLTLDVRHPRNAQRRAAVERLKAIGRAIAERRRLPFTVRVTQNSDAVACSQALTARLAASVRRCQGRVPRLVSGAGHDAVILSTLAPVAMLFVRCRGGISHTPEESVSRSDLKAALAVLVDFLERLDSDRSG